MRLITTYQALEMVKIRNIRKENEYLARLSLKIQSRLSFLILFNNTKIEGHTT